MNTKRMIPFHIFLLMAMILCCSSWQTQAATILLRGATVHTISKGVIPDGDVLIQNGKITIVANRVNALVDEVIDLTGKHLYPGMIGTTTTLGLVEINSVRATRDRTEVGEWTPEVLSWRAVNPESELIPVARANGITHVQPIPLGGTITGHSAVLQLAGWTVEDLVIHPYAGLHLAWPNMSLNHTPKALSSNPSEWKSPEDQVKQRDRRIQEITEYFESAKAYVQRQEAVDTTPEIPNWSTTRSWVRGETPLFIHANTKRQIQSAVNWAEKQGYSFILAGGRDAWRMADLLAKHQVPVIYEHTFTLPSSDTDAYDVHFSAPSKLVKAGVKVIFSEGPSMDAASSIRNLPNAAAHAVAFGLPKEEALKGLTLYPAEVLGLAKRLGSIETGKEASLIVLNGELLDIRSKVTHMWIQGKPVSLESRHTRLYDKYKNRPKAEK